MRTRVIIILTLAISLASPMPYALANGGCGGDGGEGGESALFPSETASGKSPTEKVAVSFTGSKGKDVKLTPHQRMLRQEYLGVPLSTYFPLDEDIAGGKLGDLVGELFGRMVLMDLLVNPHKPLKKVVEDNLAMAIFAVLMKAGVRYVRK